MNRRTSREAGHQVDRGIRGTGGRARKVQLAVNVLRPARVVAAEHQRPAITAGVAQPAAPSREPEVLRVVVGDGGSARLGAGRRDALD